MENTKIVMLVGGGVSSKIMYHSLSKDFEIKRVIIEKPYSRKKLIKGRIKRLGFVKVFGQLMFQVGISPIISILSKKRKNLILNENHLNVSVIPINIVTQVNSVNSKETIELLKQISPKVVVVNGTRIISKKVLNSTKAIFINTHVGITPKYRGVHGAYWALVNNDKDNCGVTVHLIDEGIDTGNILYQRNIHPTKKDTFATYPLLQTFVGTKLMANAIKDVFKNDIKPFVPRLESKLWYHPTIWTYFYYFIFKGIR